MSPRGRRRSWRPLPTAACLAFLGLGLAGCSERADAPPRIEDRAVDTELMAFLSAARSAHHRADLLEDKGDVPAAAAELERLIASPRPSITPEIREVLADTFARLADLRRRQGEGEQGLEAVEEGLKLVPEVSYYRGHLFEMRGLVLEARAREAAERGNADDAVALRERALEAFEEAIRIQRAVIERSLPAGQ